LRLSQKISPAGGSRFAGQQGSLPSIGAQSHNVPALRYVRGYTMLHRVVPAFAVMPALRPDTYGKSNRSRA